MYDTTLVTFFFDIGRENWSLHPRCVQEYFDSFDILLRYNNKIIVFIDDRYFEKIKESSFIKVFPINLDWLKDNIWAWQKIDREKEIINSENYKNLVKQRIEKNYPENINPLYTILTHSKIDFVNYAIDHEMIKSEYVGWVDFGYFHSKNTEDFLPKGPLKTEKLDCEKINICLINQIEEKDKDIIYTLQNAPEKIGAYFFWGNKNNLKLFQNLCHKWLDYFQSINIADDEQHLWLQCYFEQPDLFKLHIFNKWHQALKEFS